MSSSGRQQAIIANTNSGGGDARRAWLMELVVVGVVAENRYICSGTPRVQIRLERVIRTS